MNYFLLCICIFVVLDTIAQKKIKIGKEYVFRSDTKVYSYNFLESCFQDKSFIAYKGSVLEVVEYQEGQVIFKWARPIDTLVNEKMQGSYYFAVPRPIFYQKCYRYSPQIITFGAVVIPIKLRLGGRNGKTFDFSKDVSIGNAIGLRKMLNAEKGYSVNYLASIGITSVSLDSSTTSGYIRNLQDFAAFTPALGVVWEFNQAQIGAFMGLDLLGKDLSKHWIYQKTFSPWLALGIGVGFQIFKSQQSSINNTNRQ